MSNEMKIIMESWRSSKIVKKVFGDKFRKNKRKPKKLRKGTFAPAVYTMEMNGQHYIVLWQPGAVDDDNKLVESEVVGMIVISKTREPCIPETYEVRYAAVDPIFKGQGYGSLMYGLAFHYANHRLGVGLTSDHSHSTSPDAKILWDKFADTKGFEKKKTPSGNDTFDYRDRTDDPDDDCAKPPTSHNKEMGTDHSWVSDNKDFSKTYRGLVFQHKRYMRDLKDGLDFQDDLILKSIKMFDKAYGN